MLQKKNFRKMMLFKITLLFYFYQSSRYKCWGVDAFYNIIELLLLLYDTPFVTWKIFAGHRFPTQFFHKQILLLALSGRPEQWTSSPEIWAKCSLWNDLWLLLNVLRCFPQLQSFRSILSKNDSETFWCRQPATLLKPTSS